MLNPAPLQLSWSRCCTLGAFVVGMLVLPGRGWEPVDAAESDDDLWALIRSTGTELEREQIAELVALDVQLDGRSDADAAAMRGAILEKLAVCGETVAIEYVRGVFESDVELRDEAAYAISRFCLTHRRTPGDWRFLVRSLTVVDNEQAQSVLAALLQFRERATKPAWIREVILLGLKLDHSGAAAADRLLEHWSDARPEAARDAPGARLAAWQAWFRAQFPDEADPALPPEHDGHSWTDAELRDRLRSFDAGEFDPAAGEDVFRRAQCAACHRFGSIGEQRAPELTRVRTRLQREQILDAILYPSLHLNDEYPSATVLLKDGRILTGTVTALSPELLLLVALDGAQHRLEKDDVEEVQGSNVSGMPSGLLDELSPREIYDLFAFLLDAGPA